MLLALPGQSDGINRQISLRSVDWWPQIGLGRSGTHLTLPTSDLRPEIGDRSQGLYGGVAEGGDRGESGTGEAKALEDSPEVWKEALPERFEGTRRQG